MATRRERKRAHAGTQHTFTERVAAKYSRVQPRDYALVQPMKGVTYSLQRNQVRSMNTRPIENNYVDLAAAAYAADTTGTVTLVATIAQGASVNQRIGKKAIYKSIQIRGAVANNSSAVYNRATMLLVYDRRPTGGLPAVTDILVSASSYAFPNDTNTGRFKTLMRRDYDLNNAPSATTGTDSSSLLIDEYVKCSKQIIFKAAGTGAIGDIEEGALYLVTVGSAAAGATAAAITVGARVRYHE